jgi:hypothetical protein
VLAPRFTAPVDVFNDRPATGAKLPKAPTALPVGKIVPPFEQYGLPIYVPVAFGCSVIVMFVVVVYCEHPADAAIVYVTVYVPAVLAPRFTSPVEEFIDNPAVEVKVPPAVPVLVTVAVPALEQKGVPVYEMVAEGAALTGISIAFETFDAQTFPVTVLLYQVDCVKTPGV